MPRVRIKDNRPNGPERRNTLWKCIHESNIIIYKVEKANDAFIIIASDETVEELTTAPKKQIFSKEGYEVLNPPELTAKKTVVITSVDEYITGHTKEAIQSEIARSNTWAQVEEVIILPTTKRA